MKTYTLTNDFHNTSVTVHVEEDTFLSDAQIRRIRKALCGIKECRCGQNVLRTRGQQECVIDFGSGPNGENLIRMIGHGEAIGWC